MSEQRQEPNDYDVQLGIEPDRAEDQGWTMPAKWAGMPIGGGELRPQTGRGDRVDTATAGATWDTLGAERGTEVVRGAGRVAGREPQPTVVYDRRPEVADRPSQARTEQSQWPKRAARIAAGALALLLLVDVGDNAGRMVKSVPSIAVHPSEWGHPGAVFGHVDLNPLAGLRDVLRLPSELTK